MLHKRSPIMAFSIIVIVFGAVFINAQNRLQSLGEESTSPTTLWITATACKDNIQFASLGIGLRMRLEIVNTTGDTVFDSSFREGSLLDWQLDDNFGNRLPDDIYGCLITLEGMTGQLSHRRVLLHITDGAARFVASHTDKADMAVSSDEQDAVTILRDDEELPMVQLLHDGKSGRMVSGKGPLSFRIGNGLAGKDVEYMRLTTDGNLGIGVEEPLARLDVAGVIRASEGFQFSDGTVLKMEDGLPVFLSGHLRAGANGRTAGTDTTGMATTRVLAANGSVGPLLAGSGNPGPIFGLESGNPSYNTFYGLGAGASSKGINNSFFGYNAGLNATGHSNSFFGSGTGQSNTSGIENSFYGGVSGRTNTTGYYNAFFAYQAGMNNTTGIQNSFFGHGSGFLNTTGNDNSFFGNAAGVSNTTGSSNAFFGRSAGSTNTTESNNTFIGAFADGTVNVTNATAIGSWAKVAQSNSLVLGSINGVNGATADTNVGIGTTSPASRLSVVGDIDTTASYRIGGATVLSIAGSNNTFTGDGAGKVNTTGYSNSFFGHMAGYSNESAWFNSFFGEAAGYSNFEGVGNSFFGSYAGYYNANGSGNSIFGSNAGLWVTGSNNSFLGSYAGQFNSFGTDNSFVGYHAGSLIGTGSYNSIVGSSAGRSLSGDNNSLFGGHADVLAGSSNATAIGYRAQVARNNSLVLGSINGVNNATADTNVGIGTTAPLARLHVQNGDIYVGSAGQGMILKSPDGTRCAKLSIDNSGNLVTTSQACPGSSATPAQVLYAAQFANGDGTISEIIICNPSETVEVSGRAAFFDDNGLPMAVGISGSPARTSVDFQLKPLGKVTLSTDGLGNLSSGSVQVSSDGSVAGFVRFNVPGLGLTGVGSSQPLSKFIAPVRGKAGGIYSGIAIQNVEASPVDISLSLRDGYGQEITNGTTTIPNLPAQGHFASFIYELFPDAALDSFEGSLIAQVSGGRVAATALELGSTAGQFTTLPVAPLK